MQTQFFFAQSGAGKSYTAKVEILRHLMQGTKVIVIDPEREYKGLADSVGGTHIKLSVRSKEKINPFDLSLNASKDQDGFADHVQSLTEIISLMADGLSSEEKSVVDQAILKTYRKFRLDSKKQKKQKKNKRSRNSKIPYILVVGDKEEKKKNIAVRKRKKR